MRNPAAAILAALVLAAAAPASAEVLYGDAAMRLSGEGPAASRTCSAALTPTADLGGERAPRLAFTTDQDKKIGLVIDRGGDYADAVIVQNNQRIPFQPATGMAPDDLQKTAAFEALAGKKPFFITAKYVRSGDYVSSRYEAIDLDAILAHIEDNCPVSVEELISDPEVRTKAEAALKLSGDDVTHIRWVLTRKYGAVDDEPAASPTLTDRERDYLKRYTSGAGMPASRYLTEASAKRLIGETYRPVDPDPSSLANVTRVGDWVLFSNSYGAGRGCAMAASARADDGAPYWWVPYMYFEAYTASGSGRLVIDMAYPNPFDTGRNIVGVVDGINYSLRFDGNSVKPVSLRGGVDNAMLRAMRSGSTVELRGVAKGGRSLSLRFSIGGFKAAMDRIASNCNRTDLDPWFD